MKVYELGNLTSQKINELGEWLNNLELSHAIFLFLVLIVLSMFFNQKF